MVQKENAETISIGLDMGNHGGIDMEQSYNMAKIITGGWLLVPAMHRIELYTVLFPMPSHTAVRKKK